MIEAWFLAITHDWNKVSASSLVYDSNDFEA